MTLSKKNLGLEVLQENPHHSGVIPDAVRGLLERPVLHPDEAARLAGRLGANIPADELHRFTSDIDNALSHSRALPGGISHVPEETIELILGHAGVQRTPGNIDIARELIRTQRQQALSKFDSILTAKTNRE